MSSNYHLLLQKLDEFIRKYYLNQLLRGVIFSIAIVIIAILCVTLPESYFYFSPMVRSVMLVAFLTLLAFTLLRYIIIPFMHYWRLGKIISHKRAAQIIGAHFSNVEDKLLNILDLHASSISTMDSPVSRELIVASIDQKINNLQPIPFKAAVNLNENKRYIKYAAIPLALLLIILFAAPSLITKPAVRLLNPNTVFEKEAPFTFQLENSNLQVLQQADVLLQLKITGKSLPDEVWVNWQNNDYKMTKTAVNHFEYKLTNLQKTEHFYFKAAGFNSKQFELKVIPRPLIVGFDIQVSYPGYLGRKNELLENTGDMEVPEGTLLQWKFETRNTESILFSSNDSTSLIANKANNFTISKRMRKPIQYTLYVSNKQVNHADSISYHITVIPDLYPSIQAQETHDSINKNLIYFVGTAEDDYGLRSVIFHYQITESGKPLAGELKSIAMVGIGGKFAQFSHYVDLSTFQLKPGDRVNYYFECADNDGVNGSKTARTPVMNYEMPSMKELEKTVALNSKAMMDDLDKALKDAKAIKDKLKALQDKLLQKKELSFEEKKAYEDLLNKQKQLEQKIENVANQLEENKNNLAEMQQLTPEMQEKMDALKEMLNEMKKEDESKKMEDLAQKIDDLNKEQLMDKLEEQKQNSEQKQKELDRMMALFKKMQLDQKVDEAVKGLEDLAKKQDELQQKTDENKTADAQKNQDIKKEQDKLNTEFKELVKKMDEIKKMDKEMGDKMKMDEMEQDKQETEQDMQNASEELNQNDNPKSSKSQKSASGKMGKMAAKMKSAQESKEAEQLDMDLRAIRQLLENLVKMSFDQEQLMNQVKTANINNPQYLAMMQKQQKLKEDSKMIEDSLYSLGKSVMQIKKYVTEQMTEINKHQTNAIDKLEQRATYMAASDQQYIMTGANNLALMLSEIMQNMQMQQAQQKEGKPGSGSCNKPGGMGKKPGKGKSGQLKDVSQMSKEMQDMLEKMLGKKEGQKPGDMPGSKPGEKPGNKPGGSQLGQSGTGKQEGQGGKPSENGLLTSKDFAEMVAKQAAIRKALQQLNNQYNKDGKKSLGNLDQAIKDMELNETELANKRLTAEMLRRQKDILTRLLQAEEAERMQDQDQQRQSQTANDLQKPMPPSLQEYLKKRKAEVDLYKTVPPNLKPYYKNIVEQYYKSINM